MAGPQAIADQSYRAASALTRFRAVKVSGASAVTAVTAQGERVIGIVQETASAEDATNQRVVAVRTIGRSRAEAGAAIARDALLTVTAVGKLETAAAGDYVIGRALNAAGADGDWFDMELSTFDDTVQA